jgi:hypothetical protein
MKCDQPELFFVLFTLGMVIDLICGAPVMLWLREKVFQVLGKLLYGAVILFGSLRALLVDEI